MRNDYRRALILLRGNAPGYSGHVRLERRTLMGSMYFLAQAPADCPVLRIALVGRGRDSYYACALGEMRRDNRGQAVLCYSFDPRNVCGRELEQYQLIAVTCAADSDCRIVLYGNVNGHAELNWERVRTALCGLYAGNIARSAEDGGEAPPVGGLPDAEGETEGPAQENSRGMEEPPAEAENASPDGESRKETMAEPVQIETLPEAQEGQEEGEVGAAEAAEGEAEPAEAAGEEAQVEAPDGRSAGRTAGEMLGIDLSLPWPDGAEALRTLFQTLPPMENPPDGDYVYIEAPMPADSGYPYCAAGILAEDGAPVSVRYGLPSAWTEEPPAGLEGYAWVGDQNRGWWVSGADL